jgi:hypothetical protein
MIVIPAVVMFGLLIAVVLTAIQHASNGLEDMVNAPDGGYEKHGANIGAMLFALAVLALLAGAVGAGPLAGKVVTP